MKTRMDKSVCSWWDGPCLFEALDAIEVPLRDPNGPFTYVNAVVFVISFSVFFTVLPLCK